MERNNLVVQDSEPQSADSGVSFEQAASRIDEIVRMLERGDAPLDKSLALFEEGAMLIKAAGKMLDEAEQTVTRLQKGVDGELKESLFDDE